MLPQLGPRPHNQNRRPPNLSTDQRTSELQVRAECSSRKSKIGFVGLGQRYQPVVKEIAVVLVARGSRERRVFDAAPALYCHPGRRKSARVLDKDRNIDRLAIGCEFPTLHHMELIGMW